MTLSETKAKMVEHGQSSRGCKKEIGNYEGKGKGKSKVVDLGPKKEGPQWKKAIKNEIDSILQNHTWELVDLPPGRKPLGYRWIFKRKMKADGSIDKYKASAASPSVTVSLQKDLSLKRQHKAGEFDSSF
ncbi:hypothetical protein E3N88_16094 [Mikania micrantha]|uniref:Reverse transcriptase Ty1/copia-type domain-containing protein n=1 Tax=Mikania micrantha TaxID=192012 RepID=A0A5N6NXH2_9ASTR|nr:hypothetical protein E3N88_16094 [Mikania micrantha]